MNKKIAGFGIAFAALVASAGVQQAQAVTEADSVVTLEMQDNAAITASTPAPIIPDFTEIVAGEVITAAAISLNVQSTSGSTVTVEGDGLDGEESIANAHISLNAGQGYVTATGATLLSSSSMQGPTNDVPVAVKITNLGVYNVGTYTNTLTFTIVAAD